MTRGSEPLPSIDYAEAVRRPPTPQEQARTAAIAIGMVALLYAGIGVMYIYYVKRGVPLPMGGPWALYTFGVAAGLVVFALTALRWPLVGTAGALALFFAVNLVALLQNPSSIANGAIVKVLAFIILLRATVQVIEGRSRR